MDLTAVKKHSPRTLAFSVVFWSCLGGIELGLGIRELLTQRMFYKWTVSFFAGAVFLALGIFWAIMLLRRIDSTSTAHQ